MYHYKSCGLKNIYLVNGYKEKDTPYGSGVSIDNLDGLHRAISLHLIRNKPDLTGEEFRFLRKELDMSQRNLGLILGHKDGQPIANLEKKDGFVPNMANRIIRLIYLEYIEENVIFVELVKQLNKMDHIEQEKISFEEQETGWVETEAAA